MRKLYIDFTVPAKSKFPIFSWIIRVWQRVPYSHVRLRWENRYGQNVVLEARGTSVRFSGPIAQAQKPAKIIKTYTTEISKLEYVGLEKLGMEYTGVKYGIKQILGIAIANIFGLQKNPFADGQYSQVCSELVGRYFEEVLNIPIGRSLDMAGPREIDAFLQKLKSQNILD